MATDKKGAEDVIPTATLARLYEKQGLLKEAAAIYKELLRVDPGQEALQNALIDMETRIGGQKPRVLSTEMQAVLTQLERWQQVVLSRKKAVFGQMEGDVRILVVQGPHVESVGLSEGEERSCKTAEEIECCISRVAGDCGIMADFSPTDSEEALIQTIGEATKGYDVLVIDPGAPACAGPGTRNALASLDIPIIEVHALNPFRGDFCRKPGVEDVTTAHLSGFGEKGYAMAVRAAAQMARQSCEAKAHVATNADKGEV